MKASDPPGEVPLPLPALGLQFYIPATSSLQERQPRTLKQVSCSPFGKGLS